MDYFLIDWNLSYIGGTDTAGLQGLTSDSQVHAYYNHGYFHICGKIHCSFCAMIKNFSDILVGGSENKYHWSPQYKKSYTLRIWTASCERYMHLFIARRLYMNELKNTVTLIIISSLPWRWTKNCKCFEKKSEHFWWHNREGRHLHESSSELLVKL